MADKKKKLFPKIKKKLHWFLTDESGKITKKDALWLSAWALLLWSVEGAEAWRDHTYTINDPVLPFPTDLDAYVASPDHSNTVTNQMVVIDSATCNHASGIVNGHYSSIPTVDLSNTTIDLSKTHHWSHSSHGSHGSCWSWHW